MHDKNTTYHPGLISYPIYRFPIFASSSVFFMKCSAPGSGRMWTGLSEDSYKTAVKMVNSGESV